LGRVTLSARITADDYAATSSLETVGIANHFWRVRIDGSSHGTIADSRPQPLSYNAFSKHSATPPDGQEGSLTYNDAHIPAVKATPAYTSNDDISDADKQATFDPVSAMVFYANAYDAHRQMPCRQQAPVFDGRRRYTVALDYVRDSKVDMD